MHTAVFLPVPLHQLFPSGGINYLHTYKGPDFFVALFFCLDFASADFTQCPIANAGEVLQKPKRGRLSPTPFCCVAGLPRPR